MNGCEILAPAGSEQSAYVALKSGADAVYLGLDRFSARASAENFDLSALGRVARYAHLTGAKVYVALNTLVKDDETDEFFHLAREAWNAGADAILLQDAFLGKTLKRIYPEITLHLSTQAGCCNVYGAEFAKECGFSRAVLARETPISEIARISGIIETEAFVQGALCSSFSGQCYFSSFVGNNSGNRGRCKQPCRKKYSVDRAGYEEPAYALSLSDLSVGPRVRELLAAGVTSLKIEGRMRRPEYVAAAVDYYRALLCGERTEAAFSRLKRAYNRGDYTAGLAFGQDRKFLSRAVQGHIGERIGEISFREGKPFCKSAHLAREGDCFKLLRGGREQGGAAFLRAEKDGFYLRADGAVAGDEVRLTTDTASAEYLSSLSRLRKIGLDVTVRAGEKPTVRSGGFTFTGEVRAQQAERAPLSEEEVKRCFGKTDGLPFEVRFGAVVTENAFLPKSALNAFRREFYEALCLRLAPPRAPLAARAYEKPQIRPSKGTMTAAICCSETVRADVLVWKPQDYASAAPPKGAACRDLYLYLPPFFTEEDERLVADVLPLYDGIYCEGAYGIVLARKYRKPLFAGTGFHLTNRYSVAGALAAGVKYFALSKELTDGEQRALAAEGAFALSAGAIKLMDLIYCPFGRSCGSCDRRGTYVLTDENGRKFPLRRYRFSGDGCRFEVYNCVPLAAYNGTTNALVDLSTGGGQETADVARDPAGAKGLFGACTSGHANRSLN
ncbi:MAG: U32 family peptidase [Candidatus Gallimonas sp.]